MSTRMTSKGQVTIPKEVRDLLGLEPGSAVDFVLTPDRQVVVRAAGKRRAAPSGRFAALRGSATVRFTTDELMAMTRGIDPLPRKRR